MARTPNTTTNGRRAPERHPTGRFYTRDERAELERQRTAGTGEQPPAGEQGAGEQGAGEQGAGEQGAGTLAFEQPGTADTGDTGSDDEQGTRPRRRIKRRGGRRSVFATPKGTGIGAPKKKEVQATLAGIEGILLSVHMILANLTEIKELALTEDEAKKMADAIERVAMLYDVSASEKTIAWTNLAMCFGGIYGTRAFAYNIRRKAERDAERKLEQQQQQQQQPRLVVTPFSQQAMPASM
jgi:hypothetical protein